MEMRKWDITNIAEWLDQFEDEYELIYTKFRLKVDYNEGWSQYKRWVNHQIEHNDFDKDKYDYLNTIHLNLKNKKFKKRNPDLCLILDCILTKGFSNAFAEFLGHIGNITVPVLHRKGLGTYYGMHPVK